MSEIYKELASEEPKSGVEEGRLCEYLFETHEGGMEYLLEL